MSIDKRVADHELRALMNPQQLLTQDNTTHTIGDRRGRSIFEIGDILMAAGLIYTTIAMQGQIERLVVLDNGLIKRREQDISLVALVNGSNHQAMVLASITTYDRCTHITALTVGCQHFALQRILEVT